MIRRRILTAAVLALLGTGLAVAQQTGRLTLSELQGLIDDLMSENDAQQTEIDALGSEQVSQQGEIDALETEQMSQQADIDSLGTEQTSQQGEIDSLTTGQTSQQSQIDALETQNAALQARVAQLERLHPCGSAKCVFITAATYSGNLGGLAGADTKCREAARVAGLPGRYKAWISDSTGAAADRLFHSNVPYRQTNGTLVAQNWTDLTDGTLVNEIDHTADGTRLTRAPGEVLRSWTGTASDGTALSTTCNDWMSGGPGKGVFGNATLPASGWTNNGSQSCVGPSRLYCFQQ